jgi:hypothetical protein
VRPFRALGWSLRPRGGSVGGELSANTDGVGGHLPRDERGWRVAPAPDGRGMPEQQGRRAPHAGSWL